MDIPDVEDTKSILLDLNRTVKTQVDGCGISSHLVLDPIKDNSFSYRSIFDLHKKGSVNFSTIKMLINDGNIATVYDFERYFERIIPGVRKTYPDSKILPKQAEQIISSAHLLVEPSKIIEQYDRKLCQ